MRKCGNTGTTWSGGGRDTGRKDKLTNNKDKDCHGKELAENIFSVYAPQVGKPEAKKEAFWGMQWQNQKFYNLVAT